MLVYDDLVFAGTLGAFAFEMIGRCMIETIKTCDLLTLTAEIVGSHLSHSAMPAAELPGFIGAVFATLRILSEGKAEPPPPAPAVPIRRSVTDDYMVCLEEGARLKVLKRHLIVAHGLTPAQYRERWGLPPDYPMIAPSHSRSRRDVAIEAGFGRKLPQKPKAKRKAEKKRKRRGGGA